MSYVIAIDFEAFGGVTPRNGACQMGAVLFDMNVGQVVDKFNMYIKQDWFSEEQRCIDEFWNSTPTLAKRRWEIVDNCKRIGVNADECMDLFYRWIDEKVPRDYSCYIITDKAPFDAGILRYFSRKNDPLYAFHEYRQIVDINMVCLGIAKIPLDHAVMNHISAKKEAARILGVSLPDHGNPEAHDPVDDAEYIARVWYAIQYKLKKIQKS